jgi:hypothetical protein
MEIEEKLRLSHSLLYELKDEIDKLSPDDPGIEEIIMRAQHSRLKMKALFVECELPQLLEQIEFLDSIIFTLQDMHNKRGTK